ncbi:MAG: response regulator [Chloroflexi bacterium]|nr:response regulator [Chloroflexota bacterium]
MNTELKTAWFIDDDEEMIQAITLMMDLLGYQVTPFLNAPKAAEALQAGERPELILLDINMPQVSGIDLLEYIRTKLKLADLPIIMLSAEFTDVQVDQAYELGADAYIFKPVSIEELQTAIETAVGKQGNI